MVLILILFPSLCLLFHLFVCFSISLSHDVDADCFSVSLSHDVDADCFSVSLSYSVNAYCFAVSSSPVCTQQHSDGEYHVNHRKDGDGTGQVDTDGKWQCAFREF